MLATPSCVPTSSSSIATAFSKSIIRTSTFMPSWTNKSEQPNKAYFFKKSDSSMAVCNFSSCSTKAPWNWDFSKKIRGYLLKRATHLGILCVQKIEFYRLFSSKFIRISWNSHEKGDLRWFSNLCRYTSEMLRLFDLHFSFPTAFSRPITELVYFLFQSIWS